MFGIYICLGYLRRYLDSVQIVNQPYHNTKCFWLIKINLKKIFKGGKVNTTFYNYGFRGKKYTDV